MTNTLSYAQRLAQSKEAKDAKQLDLNVRQAQVQLLKEILTAEEKVQLAYEVLETAKNQPKLNFRNILEATLEHDGAQEVLASLISLQTELFPETVVEEKNFPVKKAATKATSGKASK